VKPVNHKQSKQKNNKNIASTTVISTTIFQFKCNSFL